MADLTHEELEAMSNDYANEVMFQIRAKLKEHTDERNDSHKRCLAIGIGALAGVLAVIVDAFRKPDEDAMREWIEEKIDELLPQLIAGRLEGQKIVRADA